MTTCGLTHWTANNLGNVKFVFFFRLLREGCVWLGIFSSDVNVVL